MLIATEDTIDTAPLDASAIAITRNIAQIQSALSEFDRIEAGLAELTKRYPPDLVYDLTSTKGKTDALAHRAAWRDPRINVEKFRKTAKAPVLALGKDIDARATWLTEQLQAGEAPIHEQIKADEARREAEKQAKVNAEFGRVQAIQEAIAEIHMDAMGVIGKPSSVIAERLEMFRSMTLDPLVFQEQMGAAQAAKDAAIIKLDQALKAQQFTEAEAAKLEAERAELAELRRMAAAQKLKDEAAAAEAARAERERAAAEQVRLDAEAAERRAAEDAAAAEARAKAQAAHEAEMAAQREAMRQAQAVADAAAAKEQARQRKMAAADKKMRDAAPVMLTALRELRPLCSEGQAWRIIDAAIEAAT